MSNELLSQNEIVRKNIAAVAEVQRKVSQSRSLQNRIADRITDFSGSMAFVYFHATWFGLWMLVNLGVLHIPGLGRFDDFPFGLLTLIVSLEAIFLSTFVLISQNRLARASERRAELDLQINLLAEQKTAKIIEMLDQIRVQLDGMDHRSQQSTGPDPEVEALKNSPDPQEVLQVIEEAVEAEASEVRAEIQEAVKDITDEMEAVHEDVRKTSGRLSEVATEVKEIKQELKK